MGNTLPNIDELEAMIEKFLSMKTETTSVKEYQDVFSELIKYFRFSQHTLPVGIKLYRVRNNKKGLSFVSLHDFWHPKFEDIKLGRLNDVGSPILYTSTGGHTALTEINPPEGMNVSCIEFEVIEPIKLIDIGLLHYTPRHEQFLRQWAYNDDKAMKIVYGHNPFLVELDRRLKSFIAEAFTRKVNNGEEHKYKISVAIAQQFLLSADVDGIAYPSVKSGLLDINIALKSLMGFAKLKANKVDVFKMAPGLSPQKTRIVHPVLGCYENIKFGSLMAYTEARPIEGWAIPFK